MIQKKVNYLFLAILLFIGFGNCISFGVNGPDSVGIFYSFNGRSEEYFNKIGPKQGKACQSSYLGLVAVGDSSIPTAAKDGKITQVTSISYEESKVLFGVITESLCTIVTGN
ncbi:hypothetical protein EHQ12_15105 [Leptospira gomenensis]|uniref:TRL-like family protein n=1 Tax=Leptospira gomenensis TaxID=2484974 RepID=A0A5F1YSC9_9LEPT|nr:TRL domain-containing protein [Leptospira gomenensis]TGK35184.1 hypothetical protein EHQ17_07015 [Leptospira gomenensis]TGK35890.1 hypothetical protein EHQ12_15105 [Leptospira gomenensis]TGK41045.1 hypothetical protein EHQ07_16775 [Leptospira gomenensis]TGK61275.1 hypothetical protein EHQ13_09455 [Leptospira gomenensis]